MTDMRCFFFFQAEDGIRDVAVTGVQTCALPIFIEIGRCSQKETSMASDNKDQPVLGHIDALVKEEERLYAQGELTDEHRGRLAKIKVELDQCWDLLRQRRALREFRRDPDQANVRPPKVVENYEQ